MLANLAAPVLLLAQPLLAWDPAAFEHHTVFENVHQRQIRAPKGSPVVKQIIESLRPNGAPSYSTWSGKATAAPHPQPVISPIERRSLPEEKPHKVRRANTTGLLQPKTYAESYKTPNFTSTQYLGISQQRPILKYAPHTNEDIIDIDRATTPNSTYPPLTIDTPLYNGTGNILIPDASVLENVTTLPYFYRDNGKGGYLNGQQIFLYADTGTLLEDHDLEFSGFVTSSIAVDKGHNANFGQPPTIVDMPGEFDGPSGYVRGFIENTQGEYAYTTDYQDYGKRYALWPESSITPLDSTRALNWPSIVYINTAAESVLVTGGNTLIELAIDPIGGPYSTRISKMMFEPEEVQFGTIGAVRSWGSEGEGGMDGWVYTFANYNQGFFGGLFLARVTPENVADKSQYQYWNNGTRSWSNQMPSATNPDHSIFFIEGPYANVDMFYSPRHLTWILVFESPFADNRFYYQYLKVPEGGIKPTYAGGEWDDLASAIYTYAWSDIYTLFVCPKPGNGKYVYGGGVSEGYFGDDDIVNGGTKMLLQWSEPLAPDDWRQYNFDTAVVEWN